MSINTLLSTFWESWTGVKRHRAKPIGRGRFKPMLDVLENRLAPATLTWTGTGDSQWSSPANWRTQAGLLAVPTAQDDVVFEGGANGEFNRNSIVDAGFAGSVAGLYIQTTFTNQITLQHDLTVTGRTVQNG